MKTHTIRRATAALLSAAAAMTIYPSTLQATVFWQGGAGNWDNAPSWNPSGQPKAGDFVYIGQNYASITYVNTAYPNATLGSLTFDAANTPTLTQTQHVLSAEEENFGTSLNGAMVQSGGTNNVTGNQGLTLGYYPGSNGSYTLSGNGVLNSTFYEYVGRAGSGIFNQTGGTNTVLNGGTLSVGVGMAGSGTYNLSGGILHTGSTTLSVSGATATFNQSGGTHTVDGHLELADVLNAAGPVQYTLSGAGILNAAYEGVGGVGKATFTQTGGTNTNSVDFRLGNNDGAVGTYNLSGGTLNAQGDFAVGASGEGIFNATGGKLTLNKALVVGLYTTSKGAFNMSNGASVQAPHVYVADNAVGSVNISGGTLTSTQDFTLATGNGTATVNLSGGSLASVTLNIIPGTTGKGTFNHSGGINIVSGNFNLGQRGAYNLSGGTFTANNTIIAHGAEMKITGGKFKTAELLIQDPASGFINVTNQSFVVDYDQFSALDVVKAAVATAYSNGMWSGPGIQSSTAAADNSKTTAVGYGEASKIIGLSGNNTAQWQGQTVDATTVLIRFTKYGDANLDGVVGFSDLVKVAQNYNAAGGESWADGDFNFDGKVDFVDLVKVAQNYNSAIPSAAIPGASADFSGDMAAAFASVPEPGAGLLMAGAAGLLGKRRRRAARN